MAEEGAIKGAKEAKGEEGFEPVVKRSSKRLARKEHQREIEREREEKEAQAREGKDSLRQHQARTKAARGHHGGARQIGGRGRGGGAAQGGRGKLAGGRGRGRSPGLGRGKPVGRGGGGASAAQHPPKRMTLKEYGDGEGGREWVLDIACGRCGIPQHPTGTVKECPIGGGVVCCQGGFERGCNPVDGRAFFRAMYHEVVDPENPFHAVGLWNDWLDQLEH